MSVVEGHLPDGFDNTKLTELMGIADYSDAVDVLAMPLPAVLSFRAPALWREESAVSQTQAKADSSLRSE